MSDDKFCDGLTKTTHPKIISTKNNPKVKKRPIVNPLSNSIIFFFVKVNPYIRHQLLIPCILLFQKNKRIIKFIYNKLIVTIVLKFKSSLNKKKNGIAVGNQRINSETINTPNLKGAG